MTGFDTVGRVLDRVLTRLELKRRIEQERCISSWDKIVGEKIARNSRAVDCRRGTLIVRVTSSAWLQELSMMSSELTDKVNGFFGEKIVKDIRFYLDRGK